MARNGLLGKSDANEPKVPHPLWALAEVAKEANARIVNLMIGVSKIMTKSWKICVGYRRVRILLRVTQLVTH